MAGRVFIDRPQPGKMRTVDLMEEPPLSVEHHDWPLWTRYLSNVERQVITAFQGPLNDALQGIAIVYHVVQPLADATVAPWGDYGSDVMSDIQDNQSEADNALPFIIFEMRLNKDTQTLRPFINGNPNPYGGRSVLSLQHALHYAPDNGATIMSILRQHLPSNIIVDWNGDQNKTIILRGQNETIVSR